MGACRATEGVSAVTQRGCRAQHIRPLVVTACRPDLFTQMDSLRDEAGYRPDVEYASIYAALTDSLVADPFEDEFNIHRSLATVGPGDRIVLCSDGIHDTLGGAETIRRISYEANASEMVDGMRGAVLSAGAPDNFSIVAATIVRISNEGAAK